MKTFIRKFLLLSVGCVIIVLSAAACSPKPPSDTPAELQIQELEETAKAVIQQTASALPTQPPVPTLPATRTPPPLRTAVPTATITLTPTQTGTPTAIPSATAPAQALMTGDTNCRTGPSNHYDWVAIIYAGETANVLGKAYDRDYWLIENPDGSGTCWVWGAYATLEGAVTQVRNLPIPPTKTPTKTATPPPPPRASLYLEEVVTCNGVPTLVIRVYNLGREDLRSYKIKIYQLPGKVQIASEAANAFAHDDLECDLTISVLERYKIGYALAAFDPGTVTDFAADVQVCTGPGSRGGCVYDYFGFDNFFLTATPTYTPTPTRTSTPTITETPTPTTATP